MGLPLTPVQILWINFAIQVPIALALGRDEPSSDLMQQPPRPGNQPLLTRHTSVQLGIAGIVMAIATLVAEVIALNQTGDQLVGLSIALSTFSAAAIFVGLSSRSETQTIFSRDFFSDHKFLRRVGLSILFTLLATELGFLQRFLTTTSLNVMQWLLCVLLGSAVLWVMEIQKWRNRRIARASAD
jgi:Ca2+-transporting ATPase